MSKRGAVGAAGAVEGGSTHKQCLVAPRGGGSGHGPWAAGGVRGARASTSVPGNGLRNCWRQPAQHVSCAYGTQVARICVGGLCAGGMCAGAPYSEPGVEGARHAVTARTCF